MPVVVTSDGLPGGSSGEVGSWPNDSPSSHTQLNVGQLLSSAVCKRVTRLSRLLSANRGYLPVTSQSTVCPHPTPLQLPAKKNWSLSQQAILVIPIY
uniref:HL04994p n=1 Tax=Drosophila melanogaster TaxID=7227 RepID=Q95RZ7_DROME|nr:HL04994p [Drosophila melanogaster]